MTKPLLDWESEERRILEQVVLETSRLAVDKASSPFYGHTDMYEGLSTEQVEKINEAQAKLHQLLTRERIEGLKFSLGVAQDIDSAVGIATVIYTEIQSLEATLKGVLK